MRIEQIINVSDKGYLTKISKKNNTSVTINPISDNLKNVNPAYYNINFTGLLGNESKKRFDVLREEFTPVTEKIWEMSAALAQRHNHLYVSYNHVFAILLVELIKLIDKLDSNELNYSEVTRFFSHLYLDNFVGYDNLFKEKNTRSKIRPILEKYLKETLGEIENSDVPRRKILKATPSGEFVKDLEVAYSQIKNKSQESDYFTDDILFNCLQNGSNAKISHKIENMIFEIQQQVMVDDSISKEKNHLQFYDTLADTVWKNIDMGDDVFITYEGDNLEAQQHLISSFVNLIKKPGQEYSHLNSKNTKIIVYNANAIFEPMITLLDKIKSDPSTNYVIIYNFKQILRKNTLMEQRSVISLNQKEQDLLRNSHIPNLRFVLLSDKDTYYANASQDAPLGEVLKHYQLLSIPMINNEGAKEILASTKGQNYIKSKTGKLFSFDAIRFSIEITNDFEGHYPEKAIKYMFKAATYFVNKDKITSEDMRVYEKELSKIQQKTQNVSQSEFKVIFNTDKKLDDIVGSPMTKAEAASIVNQIIMNKKGIVKGYTAFLDNGTSYGGGRKHTAECIAGEAEIPMIVINARDFALKDIDALSQNANLSELKIKKLVTTARAQAEANKNKTAMIYIENFDSFGSNPLYGISSIYEQKAFSQLLEEMNNLRKNSDINIVIVGSTNYPDALDEDIMKPYKFLNKIIVYSPQDENDREDILKYYVKKNNLKVGNNEQEEKEILRNAAETTIGFSVVDIIYLLEKAEEIATERKKEIIDKYDMTEAYLQTTTGRVSSKHMEAHENDLVAKHECGHAIALQVMYDIAKKGNKPWHLPDKVNFITLDPRGMYGGAMYSKDSENNEYSFEKVFSGLVCDFGGFSCEKRFFNMEGSYGITQDISQATNMARFAVEKMGMGPKTGRISVGSSSIGTFDVSSTLKTKIEIDIYTFLKNAEFVSDKIVEVYEDFIEKFAQKYKDRVGTGDCIITSMEFEKELQKWKDNLSEEKKEELLELEKLILNVIEQSKKGMVAWNDYSQAG